MSVIRRREFVTLLGGAAAWPVAARAQQPDRMRRIGVLMSVPESDPEAQAWLGAFSEGLQQLGWTAGRNIRLDYRWARALRCGVCDNEWARNSSRCSQS